MVVVQGLILVTVIFSSILAERQVPEIIKRGPLVVPYGRPLQLDPERHLKIVFPNTNRCKVTVVRDNPLSERIGYVIPNSFPCDFVQGEVRYVHLGSRAPSKDFVKFEVRVDTATETILRRVVLDITVDFTPMEIVTRNAGLIVNHRGGVSNPINSGVLHFKYNTKLEMCEIIIPDSEKGLLRYGRLVNVNRTAGRRIDCAEFLQAGIRYNHSSFAQSPNRDYIPMAVEIHQFFYNKGQFLYSKGKEYFQVAVRILGAIPNKRPEPSFSSSNVMTVYQFVTKLITTDILYATDVETKADYLILNVTRPLGPGEGSIINTDDPHNPITSFYQKDLRDLKIAYSPPTTINNKAMAYDILFEAIDIEASHSEPMHVVIWVIPRNTLSPMVTKNKGLLLFEGQSRHISSKDNLKISDKDNIENVRIKVVGGLRHGELYVKGKLATMFTPSDLDNGTVIYQHDDSDTYSDNIILNATDGQQYVEFAFIVNIIPVDDEKPVLVLNTGLEVNKNEIVAIDEFSLRATDIDSNVQGLEFLVVGKQMPGYLHDRIHRPGLQAGQLVFRQREKPTDLTDWILHYKDRAYSFYEKTKVDSFTQEDIFLRRLYYRHNGGEIFEDRFYFVLADKAKEPNTSDLKTFNIIIHQVDLRFPEVDYECTMSVDVRHSQKAKLKRAMLWFTDADSDDRKLLYTITQPPYFVPKTNETKDAGSIVLSEHPDVVLSNFTQLQLLHHKISYKPPLKFNHVTDQHVQFKFAVSDPVGHTVDNQIFNVRLHADKSQMSLNIKVKLQVNELGTLLLLPEQTVIQIGNLRQLFIVARPMHGKLYKNGQQLDIGGSFTFGDIAKQRLLYVQDGVAAKTDEIRTRLGSGEESTTFQILAASKAGHKNDPILAKDLGPSLVKISAISVEEAGSAAITSEDLQATDPDTDDLKLYFMVNSFPKRGELLVNGNVANNFSQEDVNAGLVTYRHDMNEIGVNEVQDFFNLTLSDDPNSHVVGGTHSIGFTFFVTISPVDNKEPLLEIKEQIRVREGGKVTLSTRNINVTDVDTRPEDVTCTIDVQPQKGYLENISPVRGMEQSQEGTLIISFTLRDLLSKKINYVQNDHVGLEPKMDFFAVSCSDGLKNSMRYMVTIDIQLQNDEVPELFLVNFAVDEGASIYISVSYLNVLDADEPGDPITLTLVRAPEHGVVVDRLQSPDKSVFSFPFEKIKEHHITYNHDGTDTTRDVLEFAVSDGKHEVRKYAVITVRPINDETPRLVTNTGMRLTEAGQVRMLSSSALKADDVDSPTWNLTFIITAVPKLGQLRRYDRNGIAVNLTQGTKFIQTDIDKGLIYYIPTMMTPGEDRDEIRFELTDGKNKLINQVFYIYMKRTDNIHPIVLSKGIRLEKGSSVTLNTEIIISTDPNGPDDRLQYYITKPPSKGIIEMTDQPRIPISKFTQLQLAGHKVKYVHTSSDGSNLDSFEFEVSDGTNPVLRKFIISLLDGDNTHTVVKYTRLSVPEGQTKEITSFELKAEDADSTPTSLVFSITQIPVNGFVMKRGTPTMIFTQDDIDKNLISYQHDGSDTVHDSFSFTVTDGTHLDFYVYPNSQVLTRKPQVIQIDIEAIDNKVPQIIINRGATTLEMLSANQLGLRITDDLLKAVDPDSNNTQLTYRVSVPPDYGAIKNASRVTVTTFSQHDIDEGHIFYELDKRMRNATADRFYFDLSDPGKNVLASQMFSLNWAWVSLDRASYSVSEIDRFVVVTLTRSGFLGETSFVGISVVDGSAKVNKDFGPNSAQQVQFNPGERFKTWVIFLIDDKEYEGLEKFTVRLESPVMAIMGGPSETTINIRDPEDRPIISVTNLKYFVNENAGSVNVSMYRYGDTSKQSQVMCITQSGTATGTSGSMIQSYSDFISRTQEQNNVVVFHEGEKVKNCSIKLIDDSLYEDDEVFTVQILPSLDTIVSPRYNKSVVVIYSDIYDEPRIRFQSLRHVVGENTDTCIVAVRRTGTDLSRPTSVVVRSKRTTPTSAEANKDYIPVSKTLYFPPNVQIQTVDIVILDDLGKPVREGPEYFELALALPINGRVVLPDRTLVVINDSYTDLPKIQFQKTSYTANEEDVILSAVLVRSGDLSSQSAVRCYTRQLSAKAGVDYLERPNSEEGVVTFEPGEKTQECRVAILDDPFYEGDEKLRLVLGKAKLEHGVGRSLIGERSQTIVTINDKNDRSGIGFEQKRFFIDEPKENLQSYVTLDAVRSGDASKTSLVRIFTKGGSAKAGLDFASLSKMLVFRKGVTRVSVKIQILSDHEREMREAFTVHLTKDRNHIALLENKKVIVYIQENFRKPGVTFPLVPTVVSLRDYDDVSKSPAEPIQGYPLICVTACDPKHPRYFETGSLCTRQAIVNAKTLYRWEVAAATGPDGVTNNFRSIDSETFFASTSVITLDSIYFGPGSRVRCTARAMTDGNYRGLESTSKPVTVTREDGLCLPQQMGDIGSESYSAHITYTGSESSKYPNMIRLRVLVPHIDGMLPAISTKSLSNFEITLTADASRHGQHLCSNIVDVNELQTKSGFLTDYIKDSHVFGGTEPYQYSKELRGNATLRFYRNLNLEACMWTFENFYTMTELVRQCGGKISTDGQVRDLTRSHLSVRVPLYVSYIYHSPSALGGWMHFDHSSHLKMTFTYETAVLWRDAIGTPAGSVLKGYLYPTSVLIRSSDRRLVVNFRTVARFKGTFIIGRDQNSVSMVVSPNQQNLSFKLKLLRSSPTYNHPEQMWQFVSEFSVRDYSGTYYIKLIPCTVTQNMIYSVPLNCNPRIPLTFTLPIRFQQTSDPDAVEFSVRTQFFLLARKDVWLSNKTGEVMEQSDAAFSLGAIIYGRVMVDPQQSLGSAYHVSVEKVFVCSGLDGYIPQYDPENKEFGCLADSSRLSYRFKILDRGAPHKIMQKFRNVPFNAMLAVDDVEARALTEQPNSDGFKFDSSPLFRVSSGRQWYLHAIYTIRSSHSFTRGIGKRSVVEERVVHSVSKRTPKVKEGKELPQGATLLRSIKLYYKADENQEPPIMKDEEGKPGRVQERIASDESSFFPLKWILLVVAAICFILIIAVIVLVMLYRRKSPPLSTNVAVHGDQMQGTEV